MPSTEQTSVQNSSVAKGPTIKVLAIDGGGIRGIIPAAVLAEIEKRLGKSLSSLFDLIAGTSTGGIIALGVGTTANAGKPYSASRLVDMYVENGGAIFDKTPVTPERQFLEPKYSPKALEATLLKFFGNTQFSTAITPLLISSYDLQSQLPFFFKSHRISGDSSYDWFARDVARATSAAPTFFPPCHLSTTSQDYALVDGGVFVNNPSMAAYAEARSIYPDAPQFLIVSAGTGDRQDHITYDQAKSWGLIGWAKQIAPTLMDSTSEAVDYELRMLPGCIYERLQPVSLDPASPDMDDASEGNLDKLQSLAESYIESIGPQLDRICLALSTGRGARVSGTGN